MSRSILSVLCLVCLLLTNSTGITSPTLATTAESPPRESGAAARKLRKPDRGKIVEAIAANEKDIVLVIAAVDGHNETVAREITRLGGSIQFREDEVSYLRAMVPIECAAAIADLQSVQAINISRGAFYNTAAIDEMADGTEFSQSSPITDSGGERITPPGLDTPPVNPYLPTRDIGAPQFIADNPAFDGRGVTIANIDTKVDILSPELQTATTLDGKSTRKIIDVIQVIDPAAGIKMSDTVTASNSRFTYKGISYTAPHDGTYRIGEFVIKQKWAGIAGTYPVLWDEEVNGVWVDTDLDQQFVDEKCLTDYGVRQEFGIFGKENPATAWRDTLAFVVQTLPDKQYLHIVIMSLNEHGTQTTSAAAGRGFFGGQMNGIAPGAQIVALSPSPTIHHITEALILAAKHPKVDVITLQIQTDYGLNDGNFIMSVIGDRAVERYNKPIFVGAGNSQPALNAYSEASGGSKVISVGGYVHRDTWRTVFGVASYKTDYMYESSGRGPRKDGGFKPDLIAPAAGIFANRGWGPSELFTKAYQLPPGYRANIGTSFSTPMAAGAAALLISAAKQSGISYDAERLRWAFKTTARFLPDYAPHEQGAGLINIKSAWEALKNAPVLIKITSYAPNNTVSSQYLKEPFQGPGVYEREGWMAQQSGQRNITFIRTTGHPRPITFMVKWLGNDGTFNSPTTLTLPLNTLVALPVTIMPLTAGVHSAILSLIDTKTGYPMYQTMNTVVAAEQLTAEQGYTISRNGQVEWLGYKSYFINVPTGASILKVDIEIKSGTLQLQYASKPSGNYDVFYFSRIGAQPQKRNTYQTRGEISQIYSNPMPGVWELIVENDNVFGELPTPLQTSANFRLSASIAGVEMSPAVLTVDAPSVEVVSPLQIVLTNRFGAFTGNIADSLLGSAFSDQPTLTANGPLQTYDIEIAPGTEFLSACIDGASDVAADLDLYLVDCTGPRPIIKDYGGGPKAQETVQATNPAAGTWKIVIEPFSIPSGKTTIKYRDIFTHRAFGAIKSADRSVERESGQKWKGQINIRKQAMPVGRRYLAGVIEVTSENITTIIGSLPDARRQNTLHYIRRPVALGIATIEVRNTSEVSRQIH
jgi:hypothetical protein